MMAQGEKKGIKSESCIYDIYHLWKAFGKVKIGLGIYIQIKSSKDVKVKFIWESPAHLIQLNNSFFNFIIYLKCVFN